MEEEKTILESTKEKSEKLIEELTKDGIKTDNIGLLEKVIDIHKDIANEEYWQCKKEEIKMRYRNSYNDGYNEYGEDYGRRGVPGTGRRYENDMSYGRRGVPGTGRGRYRGEEMIDEMAYHYGNYSDGKEMYGADGDTLESFKYMLKAFKDYYKHLKQEASSQEEVQLLEKTAREISEL